MALQPWGTKGGDGVARAQGSGSCTEGLSGEVWSHEGDPVTTGSATWDIERGEKCLGFSLFPISQWLIPDGSQLPQEAGKCCLQGLAPLRCRMEMRQTWARGHTWLGMLPRHFPWAVPSNTITARHMCLKHLKCGWCNLTHALSRFQNLGMERRILKISLIMFAVNYLLMWLYFAYIEINVTYYLI